MGRPFDEPGVKRIKRNYYLHPETDRTIKREASAKGISEGKVIDQRFAFKKTKIDLPNEEEEEVL